MTEAVVVDVGLGPPDGLCCGRRKLRRRCRPRDLVHQLLQRSDAPAVAVRTAAVNDEQQPLPPVVEDHRAVDHEEADRGCRRFSAVRVRGAIQQLGRLVGEVPDQAAGQRRQIRQPRGAERCRERLQRGQGSGRKPGRVERQLPRHRLQPPARSVDRHDRRGIARDKGVAAPALRTLDAFQDHARPGTRQRREQPDRRRDVRQQLGPHRHQRPPGGQLGVGPGVGLHSQGGSHTSPDMKKAPESPGASAAARR